MKKFLISIREALGNVVDVLTSNNSVWSTNAPMSAAMEVFNASLVAVDAKVAQQTVNIKAITNSNAINKIAMANQGLNIATSLFAYFNSIGDVVKMGEMKFTFSKLFYCTGYMAKQYAEQIYTTANALAVGVKQNYHFDTTLPLFRTAIDNFSYTTVRNSIVGRKEATTLIPVLLKESQVILDDQITNLMNYYRESNPDFWLKFESARKVVHSTRHTTIEGTVTDSDSGADLKAVKVTITAPGKNFEDMTDVQGKFRQQELNPELNYSVTFELDTYEPFTTTVEDLKAGEHERLSVKLKKMA